MLLWPKTDEKYISKRQKIPLLSRYNPKVKTKIHHGKDLNTKFRKTYIRRNSKFKKGEKKRNEKIQCSNSIRTEETD